MRRSCLAVQTHVLIVAHDCQPEPKPHKGCDGMECDGMGCEMLQPHS